MEHDDLDNLFFATENFFKYSTLFILIALLTAQFFHLVIKITIIPEIISLSAAFVCVFYLWFTSYKDIGRLKIINKELIRAREALKASHIDTILSLVLSQEAKDSYTYGHSERVRHYAMLIAQKLGLPQDEIDMIGRGAKLHDIGKIGIKDEVLFGSGKLTDEQYKIIKTHPGKGVVILEPLKFLDREKLIVRHHHERFDGKGYPDGLAGQVIPLGARIVCVADAFDAMRSKRLYRDPLSKEEIVRQLKSNAGTQFDPKVIDAFVANIDSFFALRR